MKLALADFTDAVASRVLTGLITSLDMSGNTATVRFDDTSAILVTTVYPSTITITLGQNILTAALSKSDNSASYLLGVDFSVSSTGVTILPGGTLATTIPMAGMEIKINYTAENTITGIPIHYRCHHGADNHGASRVFKIGDEPLILYRGKGALPSAGNLTLLGLKDEIRRCRATDGCLIGFYSGAVSAVVYQLAAENGTFGVYGFARPSLAQTAILEYNSVEYNTSSVGGKIDWCGSAGTISWDWASRSRYIYAPESDRLYIDGAVWGLAPAPVIGAAIRNYGDGLEIIVVTASGFYSRRIDKQNQWTQLNGTMPGVSYIQGIYFNSSGSAAVSISGGGTYKVVKFLIGISEFSVESMVDSYVMNYQNVTNFSESAVVAVDFNGSSRVEALYRRVSVGESTDTIAVNSVCPSGYEMQTRTVRTIVNETRTIDVSGQTIPLCSISYNYNATEDLVDVGTGTYICNKNNDEAKSSIFTVIVDMDIRYAKYSTFTHETVSNSTLHEELYTYTCLPARISPSVINRTGSGYLKSSKNIDGSQLYLNTYYQVYNNGVLSGFDHASDDSCEPIRFSSTSTATVGVKLGIGGIFAYAGAGYGLPVFANSVSGVNYRSWLWSSSQPPYVRSSGNISVTDACAQAAIAF